LSDAIIWRGEAARAAFRAGYLDIAPAIPATMAWGLVTGIAMAQSGLTLPQAYGLGLLAFAGSAQLAVLPLLASHAPAFIIVLTALLVNMRFVIYSAAMKSEFMMLSFRQRLGIAYLIGDFPFVLFERSASQQARPLRPVYFLGIGLSNLIVWQIASLAGLTAAGRVPPEWGLDFAGMVALVALVVPMLAKRPGFAACAVGGAVGVALDGLPAHAGLVIATVAGIVAAVLAERLPQSAR
jgi:predicted branched-subunit amino acid permease